MNKKRVLIGSPIYEKESILKVFLASLKNLKSDTIILDYMLVDDNTDKKSSKMLAEFKREGSLVKIINGTKKDVYVCNEDSHFWNNSLIYKVADYKNRIIKYARENNYDYIFFVDSDVIVHPNLIEHLKSLDKEIVSEIFWSKWHADNPVEPNVWLYDEYDLVPKKIGESISEREMEIRKLKFLNMLRIPGTYEVGGLGACTLINKKAILKGVNFQAIKNLTIWGEDRYFCIRAVVLGIPLFVDTHYPAYHIYRESDLKGVFDYIKTSNEDVSFVPKYKKENKITLSMVVKDEESRYLSQVLNSLKDYIDEAVIIDDGSTDKTIDICEEILKNIPLTIIKNAQSTFSTESVLRKQQWLETTKTNPDWILSLDADEVLEQAFWDNLQSLINNNENDLYCFRIYDMWDKEHYREDKYWNAHNSQKPFLIRYQPTFNYLWNEFNQHCGRLPINIFSFKKFETNFRIQHLGWSTTEDRTFKYKRYKDLDPDAIYGVKEQYESILDENPNLIKWEAVVFND